MSAAIPAEKLVERRKVVFEAFWLFQSAREAHQLVLMLKVAAKLTLKNLA